MNLFGMWAIARLNGCIFRPKKKITFESFLVC